MVLGDYLSCIESDEDPYGLVPISFCCFEMYLSHLGLDTLNAYSTRYKTKEAGEIVPEVHGVNKSFDPHVKHEHQKPRSQPKLARSTPCQAQNKAKNWCQKVLKPFVDQLLEWETEKPFQRNLNLSLRKQTSTLQGKSPQCWKLSPSPGKFLFNTKGKHQPNSIFRELLENIQVGKHQKPSQIPP